MCLLRSYQLKMAELQQKIADLKGARKEAAEDNRAKFQKRHAKKLVVFDTVAQWPLFDFDSSILNARKAHLLAAAVDFEQCTITVDKACMNEIPLH